jgi:hypothetical protein
LVASVGLWAGAREALALDVIGNINANTTWKRSDSPIRLTGDVTVAGHVTLTIEPGVVIEAAATDTLGAGTDTGRVELIIKGALFALGTASNRISFRGASRTPTGWYGILFEPGAKESNLSFVSIRDAVMGIYARSTNTLGMSDLAIDACTTGLRWQATPGPTLTRVQVTNSMGLGALINDDGMSGATATIIGSEFRSNGEAGLKLASRITGNVTRSVFYGNKTGIEAESGSTLTATNNVVAGNRAYGMLLTQLMGTQFRIINNTIDRNNSNPLSITSPGVGIRVAAVADAAKFIVRNNAITGHGSVGLEVAGGTSPSLDHNNVWSNVANSASSWLRLRTTTRVAAMSPSAVRAAARYARRCLPMVW